MGGIKKMQGLETSFFKNSVLMHEKLNKRQDAHVIYCTKTT